MSGKKEISRVRTFASDYQKAKGSGQDSAPIPAATLSPTQDPSTPPQSPLDTPNPSPVVTPGVEPAKKTTPALTPSTKKPGLVIKPKLPIENSLTKPIPKKPAATSSKTPPAQPVGQTIQTDLSDSVDKLTQGTSLPTFSEGEVDVHNAETGDTGSIVTDTKRKEFRIWSTILKSITGWAKDTEKEIAEKRTEREASKPRVGAVETRKDKLLSAAENSALPVSDDHKKITVRLREKPKSEHKSGLMIKRQEEVPEPTWESVKTPAPIKPSSQTTAEAPANLPTTPTPSPTTPSKIETAEVTTEMEVPTLTTQTSNEVPKISKEETDPDSVTIETAATPTWESASKIETAEVEKTETKENDDDKNESSVPKFRATPDRKSYKVPYVTILVVAGAIILGVMAAMTLYKIVTQPGQVLSPNIPSVVHTKNEVAIPISGSKEGLLAAWQNEIDNNYAELTQVYPIVASNDGLTRVATVEEILSVLALRAPGSFQRNITNITMGVRGFGAFMILEVQNFDTAFGGMLQWERSIVEDLAPIFGTESQGFTDITSQNRDLRTSATAGGGEVYYTFINRNTVLIANDRLLLDAIINNLK